MGAKYDTILVGGVVQTYNDNPPSDDGAQTDANRVKFATVTSDLTAPLHSAITAMDAKIVTLVDEGPSAKASAYTTVAGDYGKVVEGTGTFTLSLLNPSGNAGYKVTVKNAGVGTVTVDVDGGATVDGAASQTLFPGEAAQYRVNAAGTAYYSDTGQIASGTFATGTAMVFFQAAAPTGWTQDATNNDKALRVVSGTGGGTGGIDALSTPPATDHTHTGPSHQHTGPSHNHNWLDEVQTAADKAYNVSGVATNLTATSDTGVGLQATSADVDKVNQDLYTSNNGTGLTGFAGTGLTSSTAPTAFTPQYIDVIVCTRN